MNTPTDRAMKEWKKEQEQKEAIRDAAPELLAALEHLLDAVENAHRIDYPVEEACAAIAKVKGE